MVTAMTMNNCNTCSNIKWKIRIVHELNPFNDEDTFAQSTRTQRLLKTILTL